MFLLYCIEDTVTGTISISCAALGLPLEWKHRQCWARWNPGRESCNSSRKTQPVGICNGIAVEEGGLDKTPEAPGLRTESWLKQMSKDCCMEETNNAGTVIDVY